MKRIESYQDLNKLYEKGVRKVHVDYNLDKWCLPEEELVCGIHTIDIDEFGRLDLIDSNKCSIGEIDACMCDNMIVVYELEVTKNE